MDIFDYDAPEYTLIRNLLPDFEEIYYDLAYYTRAELNYGVEAFNQGYTIETTSDLQSAIICSIQNDIISTILSFEFTNEQVYYDFTDKYCDEISDYCSEVEFISKQGEGKYYIEHEGILFIEAILDNIDNDSIDNYDVKEVDWNVLVNVLNNNFDLKFII